MLNLTDRQLHFLSDELSISKEEILDMRKEEWHSVREKCADIVFEECADPDADRFILAESIADIKYSDLFQVKSV